MNTKAECALKVNALADAQQIASDALELAARTGNQRAGAAARLVLGEIARRHGSPDEASQRLEEAARMYRELGAKQELGDVLSRLSEYARERGEMDLSQRYAQEAYRATRTESGLVGRTE